MDIMRITQTSSNILVEKVYLWPLLNGINVIVPLYETVIEK